MDLFDYAREMNKEKEAPLAGRMRPTTLDEVVGQSHIIGKDKLLYRAIKADKLSSIIFYGPPGTGKTTLAKVIANTTKANFVQMNATTSGKKEMQEAVRNAKEALGMYQKKTILFIDEIHRFNKAQQDYLLPFVEDGTVILIGATTENPYFEVNQALISRSNVFQLYSLEKDDIKELIRRAVYDEEKGMGVYHAKITEEAMDFLADMAEGDARSALNAVELGILTTEPDKNGEIVLSLEVAQECIQRRVVRYDKDAGFLTCGRKPAGGQCQAYHDMRFGGRGKCRSAGHSGSRCGFSGGGADRTSGSEDHSGSGCILCGMCAKEQFCLHGDR